VSATCEPLTTPATATGGPIPLGPLQRIVTVLNDSWHYRELVFFFAWRDVKVRYKQALLGAAWAVLQPLLSMIVFTIVFGRLAGVPSDGLPYPLFAYAGLMLWSYVSGVVGQAGQCLTSNSNLITKVYFPRISLPLSSAVAAMLDLAISGTFLVALLFYYGITPGWPVLLVPVLFASMIFLTVGTSLFLAALNVSYRDVKYAVPLLIQLWLFITPIIYPLSAVPEQYRGLMAWNPMTGIVDGFRSCLLLNQWPDPLLTAISLTSTLLMFLVGLSYFQKAERSFADVI
jgi:lipopolysaccharide transport system permease protein